MRKNRTTAIIAYKKKDNCSVGLRIYEKRNCMVSQTAVTRVRVRAAGGAKQLSLMSGIVLQEVVSICGQLR